MKKNLITYRYLWNSVKHEELIFCYSSNYHEALNGRGTRQIQTLILYIDQQKTNMTCLICQLIKTCENNS